MALYALDCKKVWDLYETFIKNVTKDFCITMSR